jgi:hypothetical protein
MLTIAEDDVMVPVLERRSNRQLKAFSGGFVDGIGAVGALVGSNRINSGIRRRVLFKVSQRSWRADKIMINRDFQVAFGKLNERTDEK